MLFHKGVCPRQNVREPGNCELVLGMGFSVILAAVILCCLQMNLYMADATRMEDALAVSGLAACLIDLKAFGAGEGTVISNPEKSRSIYEEALQSNLGLNAGFEGDGQGFIVGKVRIDRFIVYNVCDGMVVANEVTSDGKIRKTQTSAGKMVTPDGQKVTETGVYSSVNYNVKGFFSTSVSAHKGKLVQVSKK